MDILRGKALVRLMNAAAACEMEGTDAALAKCDRAIESALDNGIDFEEVELIYSTISKIIKKYAKDR